jgi:predicted transposase YbfD/YdcC
MPFPKTWSEELISEWLTLEGYFVETNVRSHGRKEADIIGVKIKEDKMEIFHIEIGVLSGGPKDSEDMINDKFSEENKKSIIKYAKNRLEFDESKIEYKPLYITVYASDKAMNHLTQDQKKIPVIRLLELIKTTMLPSIEKWKQNPPSEPKSRGKSITLPQNLWLLYLLDYLEIMK